MLLYLCNVSPVYLSIYFSPISKAITFPDFVLPSLTLSLDWSDTVNSIYCLPSCKDVVVWCFFHVFFRFVFFPLCVILSSFFLFFSVNKQRGAFHFTRFAFLINRWKGGSRDLPFVYAPLGRNWTSLGPPAAPRSPADSILTDLAPFPRLAKRRPL